MSRLFTGNRRPGRSEHRRRLVGVLQVWQRGRSWLPGASWRVTGTIQAGDPALVTDILRPILFGRILCPGVCQGTTRIYSRISGFIRQEKRSSSGQLPVRPSGVMGKACIFCNGNGRKSKEHLWPVWMHEHLPLIGDGGNISQIDTFRWKDQTGSKRQVRQGHLTTKKLRVVCQVCNNGWMSELEREVQPMLTKILGRETIDLCGRDQGILARWIAMKAIIGEHSEQETYMTPSHDRMLLRLEGRIPGYYAIYIGVHNANSNSAWLRISQTIALSPKGPSPALGHIKRNTQSIAFICGPLFVFVLAIREDGLCPTEFLKLNKVIRIFPRQFEVVKWPPVKILTKMDMGRIAWALDEMKNSKNVRYGGDLP